MQPRELVKRALELDSPPRVPRQLWVLPWAEENHPQELAKIREEFPDDIVNCPDCLQEPSPVEGDPHKPGRYVDEWGCIFENKQSGYIGEVKQPVFTDWKDFQKVRVPIERLSVDIDQVNAFCREADEFVIAGTCPRPFERLQFIRKSENLFIDLVEKPPELLELLAKIHDLYCREMELWAKTEVDALMFMDDWGAQSSLLISPAMWRDIFKPLYKDYIDIAHRHGKYIFMHSDGYILDIIPDLIELGLDGLNSQIFCMGLENLRQFRGEITFWGEIDRQWLLPHGEPKGIAAAVRQVKDALYQDGGVIAQCEFGPGAKPENVYQVYATWQELIS